MSGAKNAAPGSRPVLLTGASGALGSMLAARLSEWGWALLLTDIRPFPGALPPGARFETADLCDRAAIRDLAAGCGAIVHMGGVSTERPFEEVLGPNISGLFQIYDAARLAGARVIFASSNLAIGYHERTTPLDDDCAPDGAPLLRIRSCTGASVTNIAYGGPDRQDLFILDASTGSVMRARMPVPGRAMFSHA